MRKLIRDGVEENSSRAGDDASLELLLDVAKKRLRGVGNKNIDQPINALRNNTVVERERNGKRSTADEHLACQGVLIDVGSDGAGRERKLGTGGNRSGVGNGKSGVRGDAQVARALDESLCDGENLGRAQDHIECGGDPGSAIEQVQGGLVTCLDREDRRSSCEDLGIINESGSAKVG